MTAVVDRTTSRSSGALHAQGSMVENQMGTYLEFPRAGTGESLRGTAGSLAPVHCGTSMVSAHVPVSSLPFTQFHTGEDEWVCTCGFRQNADFRGDPLAAVRAAGARLESLQWELDAAESAFASAVRGAASAGVGTKALSLETGLTSIEILEILQ